MPDWTEIIESEEEIPEECLQDFEKLDEFLAGMGYELVEVEELQ